MNLNEIAEIRRSVRHYKKSGLSEAERKSKIQEILSFVSENAPSWKNSQTHRYYVALSEEKISQVKAALWERNQPKLENAVAVIVSCFEKDAAGFSDVEEKKVPDNECGNEWGAYDLGLSDSLLLLKARELGLDTLIMGLRDSEKLRGVLEIGNNQEVMAVISVGEREGEVLKPGRKSLDEIVKFS